MKIKSKSKETYNEYKLELEDLKLFINNFNNNSFHLLNDKKNILKNIIKYLDEKYYFYRRIWFFGGIN